MEVPEAQDPAAAHARAALQQVHASAALVTVCRQFGVSEYPEFRHDPRGVPLSAVPAAWLELKVIRIVPARARTFATAPSCSTRLLAMSRSVPSQSALPIDDVLPRLRAALATHANVVLQAPPGAGKTTRVPLAIRDAAWLEDRRIVMLEPRRLAARAAARYMAASLGESVGATVGFRTRGDH